MMKPDLNRPHIPTPEAQKRTGLSKSYLALLLRKGSLEGFRMGRDWFIYTDSLEHFLAQDHKPGPKGPRKKPAQGGQPKIQQSSSVVTDGNVHPASEVQDSPNMSSADAHHEHAPDQS